MTKQFTDWFDALTTNPMRDGVYPVKNKHTKGYARWDGIHWFRLCRTVEQADKEPIYSIAMTVSYAQPKWRGFTTNQDVSKREPRRVWVNVYSPDAMNVHADKETAQTIALSNALEIAVEFVEVLK